MSDFTFDATCRIGKGDFGFFANYSFLPLFDTDQLEECIL
jgi:hypothetical protein